MYAIYIFALTIHAAFAASPCRDGIEIISRMTKNPADMAGTWSLVYHWDSLNQFKEEFRIQNYDQPMTCPRITIRETTPEYIQKRQLECLGNTVPFNWLDARLILDAPNLGSMNMDNAVIFIGKSDNWLMIDCKKMFRIEMRTVYDNYIMFTSPDMGNNTYMMARQTPSFEDLKCIAHNVDIGKGKGMSGSGMCS